MTPQADRQKSTVFIVDDHPLVREWLTNLINQQSDLVVCGEAAAAPEAFRAITTLKPEVAVVDISLKNSSGIELIKDLNKACPGLAVLVLSMHGDFHYAERAMRAGARGYIVKNEAATTVVEGIRSVNAGHVFLTETIAARLAENFAAGRAVTGPPVSQLSDRELEVFQLLGGGHSTQQIAVNLEISVKTVQTHCGRIKEKLNLNSATQLLHEAIRYYESQRSK